MSFLPIMLSENCAVSMQAGGQEGVRARSQRFIRSDTIHVKANRF